MTPAFSAESKSIYFASDRGGAWQLWKQHVGGGAARQVTTAGGFAPQESADGQWLYSAKLNAAGIYRIPTAGGAESVVLPSLPPASWGGWTLAGRELIYALPPAASGAPSAQLNSLDLETGKSRPVANLLFPAVQWDGALGVSADGWYALVSEVERQAARSTSSPIAKARSGVGNGSGPIGDQSQPEPAFGRLPIAGRGAPSYSCAHSCRLCLSRRALIV